MEFSASSVLWFLILALSKPCWHLPCPLESSPHRLQKCLLQHLSISFILSCRSLVWPLHSLTQISSLTWGEDLSNCSLRFIMGSIHLALTCNVSILLQNQPTKTKQKHLFFKILPSSPKFSGRTIYMWGTKGNIMPSSLHVISKICHFLPFFPKSKHPYPLEVRYLPCTLL